MIRFNGIDIDYISIKYNISLPAWTSTFHQNVQLAGRAGAYHLGQNHDVRSISVPIIINYNTERDLQLTKERLANDLITSEAKSLVFPTIEPDRQYYAIVSGGLELDEQPRVAQGVIQFICFDPFKYALNPRTVVGLTLVNNGTATTNCTIEVNFTSNQSNYSIRHVQSERETRIIWQFRAGDKLLIDMDRRIVTINGLNRLAAFDWRSQMFDLQPGTNTFVSDIENISVVFRERWL